MSKEKQINELINELIFLGNINKDIIAKHLYEKGYRKQTEGEWLTKGELFMEHYCSMCGYSVDYLYQKTPYCPNCGAKMKGGAE